MKLLVLGIEGIVKKLDLRIAVTVDAPSHAHVSYLPYPVHFLDGSMTGFTLKSCHSYMLRMTEKCMIL